MITFRDKTVKVIVFRRQLRIRHTPAKHDKLGIIHCGVTREGFIAVGGEPRDIEDGQEILFERTYQGSASGQ